MIVRIVKMTFKIEHKQDFEQIFEDSKSLIRNFPGCQHVELLQHAEDPRMYFTYSHWDDLNALENYRKSDLFAGVWKRTKALFAEKAEAHSLVKA